MPKHKEWLNISYYIKAVFSWALHLASQEVVERYNNDGRKMTFRDDIIAETESQWINSPLTYNYTTEGDLVVSITNIPTT